MHQSYQIIHIDLGCKTNELVKYLSINKTRTSHSRKIEMAHDE